MTLVNEDLDTRINDGTGPKYSSSQLPLYTQDTQLPLYTPDSQASPTGPTFAHHPTIHQLPFLHSIPQLPLSPSQQPVFPWPPATLNAPGFMQSSIFSTPAASSIHTPQNPVVPSSYGLPAIGGIEWDNRMASLAMGGYTTARTYQDQHILQQQQEEVQFQAPLITPDVTPTAHKTQQPPSGGGTTSMRVKLCTNCGVSEAPTWRRHPTTGASLCNACGLYVKLHDKRREWTVNARGQTVVKRQPRGSMARRKNQTRVARQPRNSRTVAQQRPLDLVPHGLIVQEGGPTAASFMLDHHGLPLASAPDVAQPPTTQQQQQTDIPLTFRHFNPTHFE
ncbi:hypothetical protein EV175_003853 [Coemansia sp. RSA 1933]|nr:hypothetical protein EV175_003853 [Coemansia sp. RSA 1933]